MQTEDSGIRTNSLPDLPALLASWEIILRCENKSPPTITSYLRGAGLYVGWCEDNGHPVEITRAQVQAYAAELIAAGLTGDNDRGGCGGSQLGRPTPVT